MLSLQHLSWLQFPTNIVLINLRSNEFSTNIILINLKPCVICMWIQRQLSPYQSTLVTLYQMSVVCQGVVGMFLFTFNISNKISIIDLVRRVQLYIVYGNHWSLRDHCDLCKLLFLLSNQKFPWFNPKNAVIVLIELSSLEEIQYVQSSDCIQHCISVINLWVEIFVV